MTGILAASENQLSRASRSVVLLCRERDEPHWRPPDHARLYLLPDAGLHSISGKESHLRGRPIGYGRLRLISNPKKNSARPHARGPFLRPSIFHVRSVSYFNLPPRVVHLSTFAFAIDYQRYTKCSCRFDLAVHILHTILFWQNVSSADVSQHLAT